MASRVISLNDMLLANNLLYKVIFKISRLNKLLKKKEKKSLTIEKLIKYAI